MVHARDVLKKECIVYLEVTKKVDDGIYDGKNGADCYSKNGHAVTVLTRQS